MLTKAPTPLCESQNDYQREAWMLEEHAKGKAQVLPESVHGAEELSLGLGLCRTRVPRFVADRPHTLRA